jgi:hypothetical protein
MRVVWALDRFAYFTFINVEAHPCCAGRWFPVA